MKNSNKLKECTVKINRLSFIGVTPSQIQEQMLDRRIRKCSVRVQRFNDADMVKAQCEMAAKDGVKIRRFCIRVPRLNLGYGLEMSPAASMVNLSYISESELAD